MNKKNLAYFAFFFYIITFSASIYAAEAENKNDYLTMKVTPEIGVMNGTIREYVFSSTCTNIDNKLSELDWQIKNVHFLRITADFDVLKYAYVGLYGKLGYPCGCGIMEDYDWLNSITKGWESDTPYAITNYSRHENIIQQMFTFGVNLGGNINLPKNIEITPFLSYQYEILSFEGYNGYRIYKYENYEAATFSGKVISYSQEINTLFFGLKFTVDTIPFTSFFGKFFCSPKLSFIRAMDYHHLTSYAYWDKLDFAWQIQGQLGTQVRFNNNHSAGFSAGIQYIPRTMGDTSAKMLGSNNKPIYGRWTTSTTDKGGSDRFIWSFSANYSFSL